MQHKSDGMNIISGGLFLHIRTSHGKFLAKIFFNFMLKNLYNLTLIDNKKITFLGVIFADVEING